MSAVGPCDCRHCVPPVPTPAAVEPEGGPVQLPVEPRPFRVHHPDGRTQDCTLHPNGRLTAVMAGQEWTSALSFDEMRATSWARARIEWDPAPVEPEPEPEAGAPAPSMQDTFDQI